MQPLHGATIQHCYIRPEKRGQVEGCEFSVINWATFAFFFKLVWLPVCGSLG